MPPATDTPPARPKFCYSEREAAAMIGVCANTLLKLRKQRRISFVKVGDRVFYRAAAIRQFLRAAETPALADVGRATG